MNEKLLNVLIIEDERKDSRRVARLLEKEGCTPTIVTKGKDGLEKLRSNKFDLAIVDLMLEDMDGLDVVTQAQAEKINTKLLILTNLENKSLTVAKGIKLGAKDYLYKSWDDIELSARLAAWLNQIRSPAIPDRLVWNDIVFDLEFLEAFKKEDDGSLTRLKLSATEVKMLNSFMRSPGKTIDALHLARHVLNYSEEPSNFRTNLRQRISKLREKLGMVKKNEGIITVSGVGYALV